jgi:predicted glycosyltransferase
VLPTLEHVYDEIWVYGLEFCRPLAGVACPLAVRKILYTGYLRRAVPQLTEAVALRSVSSRTCW